MSGEFVRPARHQCANPQPEHRAIWRCECGRHWIGHTYVNPRYDHWSRVSWLGRKLRRIP